jgi:hypothetical protein
MADIKELTVEGIQKEEQKERAAYEAEARQKLASAASARAAPKAQLQYMKMEAEKQKYAIRVAEKVQQETEAMITKRLQHQIYRYMDTFPFLKDKIPKIGAKASVPEMEEILAAIREEMDTQRSLIQIHKYVDFGMFSISSFWGDGSRFLFLPPALRLNLTHLNEYHKRGLFRNELEPILQEIDIEYPWLGRQSLLLRGLEALSECLIKAHLINTNQDAQKILAFETQPPKDLPDIKKL